MVGKTCNWTNDNNLYFWKGHLCRKSPSLYHSHKYEPCPSQITTCSILVSITRWIQQQHLVQMAIICRFFIFLSTHQSLTRTAVSWYIYLIMTHWFSISIIMLRYMLSVRAYTWGGFSYCAYETKRKKHTHTMKSL